MANCLSKLITNSNRYVDDKEKESAYDITYKKNN